MGGRPLEPTRNGTQETEPSYKDMPGVQPTIRMEKEMGQGLAASDLLLRGLPPQKDTR